MATNDLSLTALTCVGLIAFGASCSISRKAERASAIPGEWRSKFHVDPRDWSSRGSNTYFVLEPGYTLQLANESGRAHLTITVLHETQRVDGVETRVVEERETVDGNLVEVSRNYFAISTGTSDVYYFGEDVDIYEHGVVSSHEGGWHSGVDGATFGLAMPGTVHVGARFYQEHAPGKAMDRFEIKSTEKSFDTPAGHFDECLQVEETTPLEPGDKETKLYAPRVGLIQDEDMVLVSHGFDSGAK